MTRLHFVVILCFSILISCLPGDDAGDGVKTVRQQVDTVGFAQYDWQTDSIMARLDCRGWQKTKGDPW